MKGIPISELDKDTLKKLGMDGLDSQVIALSHILDSIRSTQKDDAIWALKKALSMLEPKEEPAELHHNGYENSFRTIRLCT